MIKLLCSTAVAWQTLLLIAPAAEPNLPWPRFRGPNGSGIAVEKERPPTEFGPEKNLKWKTAAPGGPSSPIVVGDFVVLTAFDEGKLLTIAYHRESGQEVWRREARVAELEQFHKVEGSPASSSAATDGRRIVVYFGSCGLICYDLAGNEQWTFKLPPPKLAGGFGSGVSPIIVDDLVVLVRDEATDPKILALDAATGALRWQTKRLSTLSYGTPVVYDTPKGKQIVTSGHARMAGYDVATGQERWTAGGLPAGCCPSPVVADGIVYFAGSTGGDDGETKHPDYDGLLEMLDKDKDGALSRAEAEEAFQGFFDNQDINKDGTFTRDEYDTVMKFFKEGQDGAFALRPDGTGDLTESKAVWKQAKGLPQVPSAIVYRGQCVLVKDGGIVTAYDISSGKQIYQKRIAAGRYYASPTAAAGNIYFTSLEGVVTVLQAGVERPEVVAENKFDERTAATPAFADHVLYFRTEKFLYAFAEAGKPE